MNKSNLEHLTPDEAKMVKVSQDSSTLYGNNTIHVTVSCNSVLSLALESREKITVYYDNVGNPIGLYGKSLNGVYETMCCPDYPYSSCATNYASKEDFYPDSEAGGSGTDGSGTGGSGTGGSGTGGSSTGGSGTGGSSTGGSGTGGSGTGGSGTGGSGTGGSGTGGSGTYSNHRFDSLSDDIKLL